MPAGAAQSHDESQAEAAAPLQSSWWVRALSRIPLGVWHAIARVLAMLAHRVVRYRHAVVDDNLHQAFPDLDADARAALARRYYEGFADVLVEIIKSPDLDAGDFRDRVRIEDAEPVRDMLRQGQPVILVTAHQCNWEWLLYALSLELGGPVDAAYKPLKNGWAEREMLALRSRFGNRMVPAKDLLFDIMKRRKVARGIAIVADQEPRTSEHKYWTCFLNRETAFFQGVEEIARTTRYPAFFVGMRRVKRGYYESNVMPLAGADETLAPGEFTERYARLVEAQIRESPADWPWSHKRWRLRKPLYD